MILWWKKNIGRNEGEERTRGEKRKEQRGRVGKKKKRRKGKKINTHRKNDKKVLILQDAHAHTRILVDFFIFPRKEKRDGKSKKRLSLYFFLVSALFFFFFRFALVFFFFSSFFLLRLSLPPPAPRGNSLPLDPTLPRSRLQSRIAIPR